MTYKVFLETLKILELHFDEWNAPVLHMMKLNSESPYKLLITTLLSLRSKDERTAIAAENLFKLADTPQDMVKVPKDRIRKAIFTIGFYEKKSQLVLDISQTLLDKYNGEVPQSQEKLLSLNGVGLKTANLVLASGFGQPYICVDIHVHRISNRWGFINTKSPEDTEAALSKKVLDKEWWFKINYLMVGFGQTLCKPVSPLCSECPVVQLCEKVGVDKHR